MRKRMAKRPYPDGFLFAMGSAFWTYRGKDEHRIPNSNDIDEACEEFLNAFGSMSWRIDRMPDGSLHERTNW